ncbi:hypothetical protein RHSIM_Rhsim03G0266100 [Rhododendron simsii]|uniref:Uncharacterized protein n=1 Tax=Rhododendron simsii TaxID=118357 RepID=A0A834LS88_RHOSS|nr:hypothetical protein RHSIM_Rhsim03G0266100 [Rhododendron simsii]
MLIQSSLPGSIEETWQQCPKWEKNPRDGYEEVVPVIVGNKNIDDMCSLNFASSCSQLSTVSTMSENSRPAFVYKRRKLQTNAVSVFQALTSANLSGGCISAIRSEAGSVVGKEGCMVSVMPPVECVREVLVLNSESISGCVVGEEPGLKESKEALKSDIHTALDFGCVNDSYSSSKSNVELGSSALRIEVDDTGECSSSSALVVDGVHDDQSEKEIFISILRSQGLLEGVLPTWLHPSAGTPGACCDSSYTWTCKVCDHPETTVKMLICDQCEEAFHVSCCNPRIRKVPVDEWYCQSCSKKKHKILKEDAKSKTVNISSERSRFRNATSEKELGPMASMLIGTEPYEPGVRIGQDFQAEVPDWCGPSVEEVDTIGNQSEIDPSELVSLLGWNSNKPSRVSSIGNWLQCREVIEGMGEGGDGAICGKWRRAPLFEVQTDDWECFCAVLWDPAHADCAVPQELDTDQVMKQLKYIEMLRPRLAAKRRKLDIRENAGSQDCAEDVRNIRNP